MTDNIIDTVDTVPEADFVEQSVPAYPLDDEPDLLTVTTEHEAAEADVLEQSIPVPLDDDYAESADSED